MADHDQTADRPAPERPGPGTGRPVPDRSGAPGGPPGSPNSYGMTWIALVALLFMVVVVGWRLFDFYDSRQPPSGTQTQEATVLGFEALGTSQAGSKSAEHSSVVFELPDGEHASALYELRRLGDHEEGDTITVFEQDGEWRTTAEKAWGPLSGWALGLVALLTMIVGWFRVRMRVRRGDSAV